VVLDHCFLASAEDSALNIPEGYAIRKNREMKDTQSPVEHGVLVRGVGKIRD
jgi:hypothetical protein